VKWEMRFHYPPVFDVGNVGISDIEDFKNVKYLLLEVPDIRQSVMLNFHR
jgi:hypothetical protein